MSSRWATKNDEDLEIDGQRKKQKQEKQEKRRLKEERERQHAEKLLAQRSAEEEQQQSIERPRTASPTSEGAHILDFPTFTYAPCRNLDSYEVLNNIEEGSYGFVSRARTRNTGEIVALKRLKMDSTNEGFPVTGLREIQTLRACSHQHIVNLREVVIGPAPVQDVYIVMDFLEHDLKDLLQDMDDPFSPSEVKTLLRQICSATEYLHANWIIHRDLKTSNLLLNNRGEIKIADFGMARYTANPRPKLTQLVVTLWYRAPELLLGAKDYDFEIDIWSVGCIFSELLTREPVFSGKSEITQLSEIFSLLGAPTLESWPDFKSLPNSKALSPFLSNTRSDSRLRSAKYPHLTTSGLQLLSAMLTLNPASRPSASDVLSHPYFKEDPRPKPTEMFPTFPSRAGGERRRRRTTPQAPDRGDAPQLAAEDFANAFGQNKGSSGAEFDLKMS